MPFKSEKQRRYLWANEPEIARKWAGEEKRSRKSHFEDGSRDGRKK